MQIALEHLIDCHARSTPSREAVCVDDRIYGYGDLHRGAELLSKRFAEEFAPGQAIATWFPNGVDALLTVLAGCKASRVMLPLARESTSFEVGEILRGVGARDLIVPAPWAHDIADSAVSQRARIWSLDASRLRLVCDGTDAGTSVSMLPPDIALILHSSGTTGRPKGVALSRSALEHILAGRIVGADIDASSRAVVASSLAQTVGLFQALAFLACGARLRLIESYEPTGLGTAIEEYGPSHLIMVVGALERLLESRHCPASRLDQLRFASVGGDQVSEQVQQLYYAVTGKYLSVSYGMTELSWMMLNKHPSAEARLAVGRPTPGVDVRLMSDHGEIVSEPGFVGELQARGPKAALGYVVDGQLNTLSSEGGWISSGDRAYRDELGTYWFCGRLKDVIVLDTGDCLSPQEIERHLQRIAGIDQCVVVGMPKHLHGHRTDGEVPWGFVVCSDPSLTEERITAILRRTVSAHKVPHRFVFLDELPLSASGKLARRKIREWYLEGLQS